MIHAVERWRAVRVTDFERRQMTAVRAEFDQEYEARNSLVKPAPGENRPASFSPLREWARDSTFPVRPAMHRSECQKAAG